MKKEKLTYEEAIQRLETIVESLEQDKLSLEDLGKSLAEAKNLAQICKEKLALAENDIKKILEEDEQE
ncbi:MAG: exodeoxyribonuclease VII small subunit [Bacteroidales bacterium]|nr:exodeoxyribonuclease VII small subunit [Bacteroidales bacterium]